MHMVSAILKEKVKIDHPEVDYGRCSMTTSSVVINICSEDIGKPLDEELVDSLTLDVNRRNWITLTDPVGCIEFAV